LTRSKLCRFKDSLMAASALSVRRPIRKAIRLDS